MKVSTSRLLFLPCVTIRRGEWKSLNVKKCPEDEATLQMWWKCEERSAMHQWLVKASLGARETFGGGSNERSQRSQLGGGCLCYCIMVCEKSSKYLMNAKATQPVKMKFNEYLSVLLYKLVLVISLIHGGALSEKDKTGKHTRTFSANFNQTIDVSTLNSSGV